jgi:hypothetical protein
MGVDDSGHVRAAGQDRRVDRPLVRDRPRTRVDRSPGQSYPTRVLGGGECKTTLARAAAPDEHFAAGQTHAHVAQHVRCEAGFCEHLAGGGDRFREVGRVGPAGAGDDARKVARRRGHGHALQEADGLLA